MGTPFLRPNLIKKEVLLPYLQEVDTSRLYSNFGPLNTRFEHRVVDEYFEGVGAVTTVSNATTGLILAIQSSRKAGKYAVMPSFTFAATPLAAKWAGLEPFFVDIRSDDWCMNEDILAETLTMLGDEVGVVVPYATFGSNLNLDYYRQIHDSGIPVVIDAAASFGASVGRKHFGLGFPGYVVFSFHATKAFGIGEGGLIYSANHEGISRLRQAENFGFSAGREVTLLGLNGKMSEYMAAMALATLDVYEEKMKRRQDIYQYYADRLQTAGLLDTGWKLQQVTGDVPHQFMPVCCPDGVSNRTIIQSLRNHNIEARTYFSPPCHQQLLFAENAHSSLFVTEQISDRIMSLPLWEEMTERDIQLVVEGITS